MKRWMLTAETTHPQHCSYPKRWEYAKTCNGGPLDGQSPQLALDRYYRDALNWIHTNYPTGRVAISGSSSLSSIGAAPGSAESYWSQSHGRDHVFVFPHGAGANDYMNWQHTIRHSIFLTPESNLRMKPKPSPKPERFTDWFRFDTWKDIPIPGYVGRGESLRARALAALPPPPVVTTEPLAAESEVEVSASAEKARDIFIYFRGSMHGPNSMRRRIKSALEADVSAHIKRASTTPLLPPGQIVFDEFTEYGRATFDRSVIDRYHNELLRSVFCVVVRGTTVWTRRLFEAMLAGCIPVVCNDHYEFPFSALIEYDQFVIRVPEVVCSSVAPGNGGNGNGHSLLSTLLRLTPAEIQRKQWALAHYNRGISYPETGHEIGDAFTLLVVELERKLGLLYTGHSSSASALTIDSAEQLRSHPHIGHRRRRHSRHTHRGRLHDTSHRSDNTSSNADDAEWGNEDGLMDSYAGISESI